MHNTHKTPAFPDVFPMPPSIRRPVRTRLAWLVALTLAGSAHAADGPFRLNDSLGLSEGFRLSVTERVRYETLSNSIRVGASENDQLLTFRTMVEGNWIRDGWRAQVEIFDGRQELADIDSEIGTGEVDTLDILQANLQFDLPAALGATDHTLKVGRYTHDLGSRVLMARNIYRTTINAFDGAELLSRWDNGAQLRLWATRPVDRLPADFESILHNDHEFDEMREGTTFAGAYLTLRDVFPGWNADLYVLHLNERDTDTINTRNRDIRTAGLRLLRPPARGQFDFDWEFDLQRGESRASAARTNTTDLSHKAGFVSLRSGYSFGDAHNTRLVFEYDHSSGDNNPTDGENNRFDSLFGVVVFAYGPVSLYSIFDRSNLITPGLRLITSPIPDLQLMMSYRHFWLDSATDTFGRTGLRDVTGQTDTYMGQHLETRFRWNVIPGNVMIELAFVVMQSENLSERTVRHANLATTFTF